MTASAFLRSTLLVLALGTQCCAQSDALQTVPKQTSDKSSQAALEAVRVFYVNIVRYHPIGIPQGPAKKALWPLLSRRLVVELNGLQACDDDYFRRYGEILRANQYKPATPWLEEGLFSGPNEAVSFTKFSILGSRTIGENRVGVHLRFTQKQTYTSNLGLRPSYDHTDGVVTVILEDKHWVIDDFKTAYGNDGFHQLSDGYSECKSGRWVGKTPY